MNHSTIWSFGTRKSEYVKEIWSNQIQEIGNSNTVFIHNSITNYINLKKNRSVFQSPVSVFLLPKVPKKILNTFKITLLNNYYKKNGSPPKGDQSLDKVNIPRNLSTSSRYVAIPQYQGNWKIQFQAGNCTYNIQSHS